jgi:hypothetical protein
MFGCLSVQKNSKLNLEEQFDVIMQRYEDLFAKEKESISQNLDAFL